VDEFFLSAAAMTPSARFVLGGNGWHDKPMPSNVKYVHHVYTHEHNSFNSTPRLVLNVSRDSMARFGFSPATRVFEAAGAAACIVTDYWDGIGLFLEPDREVLVARNGEDVANFISSKSQKSCRTIGDEARRRVLAEHTYDHRARQVEQLLTGAGRPAPSLIV
jgi:spore maturation protein CgeB